MKAIKVLDQQMIGAAGPGEHSTMVRGYDWIARVFCEAGAIMVCSTTATSGLVAADMIKIGAGQELFLFVPAGEHVAVLGTSLTTSVAEVQLLAESCMDLRFKPLA